MPSFRWSVVLLHLSRLPKQELPNYGQQVSTLRICNIDVKSKWAKCLIFGYFCENLAGQALFLEDSGKGFLATAQHRELIADEIFENCRLVFDLDVVEVNATLGNRATASRQTRDQSGLNQQGCDLRAGFCVNIRQLTQRRAQSRGVERRQLP